MTIFTLTVGERVGVSEQDKEGKNIKEWVFTHEGFKPVPRDCEECGGVETSKHFYNNKWLCVDCNVKVFKALTGHL